MIYFGARYYDPNQPRFMSADWADKPEAAPYSDLADPQSLNLYTYVRNNPVSRVDTDGHDIIDYGCMCAPNQVPGSRPKAAAAAMTVAAVAGAVFGLGESALGFGSAGTIARNLLGWGLATAPVAVPTAIELSEALNPGGSFGFRSVSTNLEGYTVGRLANGAEVAAQLTKSGENVTANVLGAYNRNAADAAGTLSAIVKGAQAAAKEQGAKTLTLRAVAVTNKALEKLLLKQGFTPTTVKIGKETVGAFEKTLVVK